MARSLSRLQARIPNYSACSEAIMASGMLAAWIRGSVRTALIKDEVPGVGGAPGSFAIDVGFDARMFGDLVDGYAVVLLAELDGHRDSHSPAVLPVIEEVRYANPICPSVC